MHRTRMTIGSNILDCDRNTKALTADLIIMKLLLNSILSTPEAKFMTIDIKKFYLETELGENNTYSYRQSWCSIKLSHTTSYKTKFIMAKYTYRLIKATIASKKPESQPINNYSNTQYHTAIPLLNIHQDSRSINSITLYLHLWQMILASNTLIKIMLSILLMLSKINIKMLK